MMMSCLHFLVAAFKRGRSARPRKAIAFFLTLVLTSCLLFGYGSPARSQSPFEAPNNSAPVVLDGRVLFRVFSTETLSAQERAQRIEERLQATLLTAEDSMLVSLDTAADGEQANISANGQHLVTVTQVDTIPEHNPEFQAYLWIDIIDASLGRALLERSTGYRAAAFRFSAIALGAAVANYLLITVL